MDRHCTGQSNYKETGDEDIGDNCEVQKSLMLNEYEDYSCNNNDNLCEHHSTGLVNTPDGKLAGKSCNKQQNQNYLSYEFHKRRSTTDSHNCHN